MKNFRFAWLLACALALAMTGVAFAHAKFVKSDPAPDSVLTGAPKQVTVWFTEELDTKASLIKVFDAANAQVDLGNSKVNLDDRKQIAVSLKPLTNGVFTVKWHAVADDDKGESDGEFKFTVQVPTTPTVAPTTAPSSASTPTTVPPTATPLPPTTTPLPATPTRAVSPTTVPTPTPPATSASLDPTLLLIVLSVVVLGLGAFVVLRKK